MSTRYVGKLGTSDNQRPVAVKLPPLMNEKLKQLPNKSDFLRRVIAEGMQRAGMFTEEEILHLVSIGVLDKK
ncbi:hypothetical protein H6G80_28470 [Nostoc sp. FACHB-87]|uniref:hypothetical protein n=1 Tax=Nostocaceae TaxID=1162 RepID=UPI001685C1A4|nr:MULTISPECIES: hypothetical protein [Nostocaceae]MBD2457987.1 hypothetical protein [Nostoc sp. FACHB-87]MBD2479236.1 hypothetical protein [Anabaena sp. FACHB-83]